MATAPAQLALIHVVEDNIDDEQLMLRALKKSNLQTQVTVSRDGEVALRYHEQLTLQGAALPALILLDLKLPKVSGFEVLRAFREHEKTREVPIVIVTSSDEATDTQMARDLGANDYLRKPNDYDKYMAAVASVCKIWLPSGPDDGSARTID